jgi:hypothetical protein
MIARFVAVITLLLPMSASAGSELVLDTLVPGATQRIAPGTYDTIHLLNTLPQPPYTVDTKVETHAVGVIDLDAERKKADAATKLESRKIKVKDECANLRDAVNALIAANQEKDVPMLVRALEAARKDALGKGCAYEDLAGTVIALTQWTFATHLILEKGSFVTVTAYRVEANGDKTKVVEKIFDTGESGSIRSHLILGMHPNKDERWFAKVTGSNPAEYTITREVHRDSHDPLGAVLFTWLPSESTKGCAQFFSFRKGDVAGSFTAGIGFDSNDPIYLFGYALNISESFGVAGGVAGFNQSRLKGIYKGDGTDKLTTNLQPDQLIDDTFGTGWFFGITYRR